jgi:predicted Rossmann fold flavoprotein
MIKEFDNIIIGAGPAGLFTAINISSGKTLIIEKMSSAGKKLLMSGSGRCNITQSGNINDFFGHYGDGRRFLMPALKEFTNIHLMQFINHRGLQTIDIKGKIFPASENSRDVLNLLLKECQINKVLIQFNEQVKKIEVIKHGFSILSDKDSYLCRNLMIATGGKSYPLTGSTGDGYYLARSLGHSIEKPKPALTPVYIKDYRFRELSGISLPDRKISILRDGHKLNKGQGSIGFTHWGLSGPGILDLSRYIEPNDTLIINLIDENPEALRNSFIEAIDYDKKISLRKFLKSFVLPENLILLLLAGLKLEPSRHLAEISKALRNAIIQSFCEYPFIVERTGDFNIAMATKGGVSLPEVSSKTMESKLVRNLYFAGEVLDIDGDTGGYNIQAAFSTGYLAAKHISMNS